MELKFIYLTALMLLATVGAIIFGSMLGTIGFGLLFIGCTVVHAACIIRFKPGEKWKIIQ